MRTFIVRLTVLLAALAAATSVAAQDIELWIDGRPAWYWMYPDPELPFSIELRLAAGSTSVQGMEAALSIHGMLEIVSISVHNDAENLGLFVPFEETPGGVQELRIADFGECIDTSESKTLVSVQVQLSGESHPCSWIVLGGLTGQYAISARLCDGSSVDVDPDPSEGAVWCPDEISQSSVGTLKGRF